MNEQVRIALGVYFPTKLQIQTGSTTVDPQLYQLQVQKPVVAKVEVGEVGGKGNDIDKSPSTPFFFFFFEKDGLHEWLCTNKHNQLSAF